MFTIPTIGAHVPLSLHASSVPSHVATLVRTMAEANVFQPSDLRTSSAGLARMIERVFERWANEDDLPKRQAELPLQFCVSSMPKVMGHDRPMLILDNCAQASRWYIGHALKHWLGCPEQALLEHATAKLYYGLDQLCYAPKPPEYLAWARALWWDGGEGDKRTAPKQTNPLRPDYGNTGRNTSNMPLRRAFDSAYPRWMQVPQTLSAKQLHHIIVTGRRDKVLKLRIGKALHRLAKASRAPHLLTANAHTFDGLAPARIACYIRHHQGDMSIRLIDDYLNCIHRHGYTTTGFHGAWPLDSAYDLRRARLGIAANTQLAQCLIDLMHLIGSAATASFLGVAH